MNKKQKKTLWRIGASVITLVAAGTISRLTEMPQWAELIMYLIPYLIIGYDILIKAGKGILNRQMFDENFLMSAATIGALALGEFGEGAAVMLLYQIGELFQSIAVGKSRRDISALMDICPDTANVEEDGRIVEIDPYDVEVGREIIVRPGERIPIDGIITDGTTTLDTSALTGESLPADAAPGTEVHSGSINMTGLIRIRTTKEFDRSTAARIMELVEESGSRKSRSENFITKFARYYTPAVSFGALALALAVPLVRLGITHTAPEWGSWIMRALTFLVISCPCALVISIPLSFFSGIGGAGRRGILIKGSNYLETLARTKYVVFDKTGTITRGVFEVEGVHHNSMEQQQLLEYAALAESGSNHPIANSIRNACKTTPDTSRVTEVKELAGLGIKAVIDGKELAVGNEKLMRELNIDYHNCHKPGTIVHIAVDGSYAGHILISDVIKPTSELAAAELKRAGIKKTVMLTGDTAEVAQPVAKAVGIDEVYSGLLPADKVDMVEKLLSCKGEKEVLAFVGDGINDAPVLARADVGIAMGALGSDAAIEAADIVLMDDDPLKIAKAVGISKKCMRIVYENIYFALGVKLICLALGALGLANMWLAVFADVGVMIIAVLNAVRTYN
ncbi:MAG: heavy metal translocating P-type ATPase [Clostridiales bacterium]|nr:heavy metal translocating P-type ATPase [Clostridiales bacterium]